MELPFFREGTTLLLSSKGRAVEDTWRTNYLQNFQAKQKLILPAFANLPAKFEISDNFETLDLEDASLSKLSSSNLFSSIESGGLLLILLCAGDGRDSTYALTLLAEYSGILKVSVFSLFCADFPLQFISIFV